ncbi:MAG: histidinol dehydrogenase [Planctomycetia bacterium]|nr:histidinol dehydrogenase [Planctomycetia bacterium]
MNIPWYDTSKDSISEQMSNLRRKLSPKGNVVSAAGQKRTVEIFGKPLSPQEVVTKICQDVEKNGLKSVLEYSAKIDGATLTADQLRVPLKELEKAHAEADPDFLTAVRNIQNNIRVFQTAILHSDTEISRPGGYLKQRYRPLRRVGICVPGGAAAYPSSVLMTAVPAMVAGVQEIAVVAPPTKNGAYNTDMLAVCYEIGIREVYRVGGAQAVAALAYGVDGLPRVDKIVGPGNLFVALAKKHVYGEVDIDSIAGPSEVMIIVDKTTDSRFTALDLIAQAEHAPGASILISTDRDVLQTVVNALENELQKLERGELARQCLEDFGAVILAKNEEEVCRLTDELAPEHLHIATENAAQLEEKIHNAGAVFLGNYTPVALGDYAAGPSHVLPTSGTARFARGLSSNDFLRSHSVLYFDHTGLTHLAPEVAILATKEGLTAHRESVTARARSIPGTEKN